MRNKPTKYQIKRINAAVVLCAAPNDENVRRLVEEFCNTGKCHPFAWDGYRRHIRANDKSALVRDILWTAGVEFRESNDAPKGGRNGLVFVYVVS